VLLTLASHFLTLFKRGDPSAFGFRMARKGKVAKILEHSQFFVFA